MRLSLACVSVMVLFLAIPLHEARAQGQQITPSTPTIKVTSALVFLDVTVLDKKGHPVVSGLTKDDFTITEDKMPQAIFSFEAPEVHVMGAGAGDENPNGKAPETILVMDLLNSSFEDFDYIRYEVEQFLKAQPPHLASPTELLVIGNESLEMLQSFTLAEAVQSTIPFDSLNLSLSGLVRHTDTRTANFTVEVKSKNLRFEPSEDGTDIAQLIVTAASLSQYGNILASRMQTVTLVAHSQDPAKLPDVAARFPFMLRFPRRTRRVRVIIQEADDGRIGSAEIDRKTIDAAPTTETPRPELKQRPGPYDNQPPTVQ